MSATLSMSEPDYHIGESIMVILKPPKSCEHYKTRAKIEDDLKKYQNRLRFKYWLGFFLLIYIMFLCVMIHNGHLASG